MKVLIVLNDPPYGTERSYNGMRLALSLARKNDVRLKLFLMADSVSCAKSGQKTPTGYYNLERMLKSLTQSGVSVGACGSCLHARGMKPQELAPGVHSSSMDELTDWTLWADKVIAF